MKEETLNLLGKLALEYRLSLSNLCKLMNLEQTEENKKKIYNEIMSSARNSSSKINEYKYLFNYETSVEDLETSNLAYKNAIRFLRLSRLYNSSKNPEQTKQVFKMLDKTDLNFKKLKETKDFLEPLTEEEITIITKYRIKHCISKSVCASYFNISRDKLSKSEKKIQDPILNKKIELLSNYFEDLVVKKRRNGKM